MELPALLPGLEKLPRMVTSCWVWSRVEGVGKVQAVGGLPPPHRCRQDGSQCHPRSTSPSSYACPAAIQSSWKV